MSDTKLKILLMDDDRFLLDMYALKFKSGGHEIETVSSSVTALEKLRNKEVFDVLILDIIMPGMSGIELLKTIRDEKLALGAAVIMLTNEMEEVQRAKDLQADGYIVKATATPSEVVEQTGVIYENKHKK